ELLRDVDTRWDSVYFMINCLHYLQQAIDYFLSLPVNRDISQYNLSPIEWQVLKDFELVLEIPHGVQQSMSSESTRMLSHAIPAFEKFMEGWEE
ncbi:hypothetical protein M405DRAFT_689053, partial [Rhizopogon salebrosus TDB-379]